MDTLLAGSATSSNRPSARDSPRLHPLKTGDLLDTVFRLYRLNFGLFAGVVAALAVPQTVLTISAFPWLEGSNSTLIAGLALWLAPITVLVSWGLIVGALAGAVSARYLGQPISVLGAYRMVGVRSLAWLLLSSLFAGLVVIIGFSIFFLPGIYFFCRFAFLPQAIVLERAGIMESWNRSWFLVDGSWWRVFRLIATVFVLYGILLIIGLTLRDALGVLGNLPDSFAGSLGQLWNAAVEILVLPIPLGVLTVLFYDLRVRKEGFDLELMAQDISGRGTA
jgi:hypothetical protein